MQEKSPLIVKRYLKKIAALSAAATLTITGVTGIVDTSSPTATAAGEFRSTFGTEFWVHFDSNNSSAFTPRLNLASAVDAQVTVTWPDGTDEEVSVTGGTVVDVVATSKIATTGAYNSTDNTIKNTGIHIVSDVPISVYTLNLQTSTSDASVAYPSSFAGTRYRILATDLASYNSISTPRYSVLATEAGTTVITVTPYSGGTAGTPFTKNLSQGESYTNSFTTSEDASGTLIEADKKVVVSSSDSCINLTNPQSVACDAVTEFLPPVSTWGKSFILPTNSVDSRDPSSFFVAADQDGTTVTVNGTNVSLNGGETHIIQGSASAPYVDVVTSDKPIAILQIIGSLTGSPSGDPAIVMVTPSEQFLNDALFATPGPQFTLNELTIVGKTADVSNFTLDESTINSSEFTAISGTDFSVARVTITQGTHRVKSTDGFALYAFGYNNADSYAYSAGNGLVDTVANPGGTADTGFRSVEQVIQESGGGDTTSTPAPYTGPLITDIGEDNIAAPYQTFGGQTVRVDGERLSGVTKVFIDGKEGTVVSTADDHFVMIAPEGLTPGIYNLEVQSSLGNLTYLDGFVVTDASANFSAANAVCDGVEPSWWTQRISDTEAKAYIKCPEVGQKYRILQQTGGSGEYTSIFAKTLTDENDTTQVFNEFGRYIVRTIDLEDVNRIRIRVDDVELWKVRYNN